MTVGMRRNIGVTASARRDVGTDGLRCTGCLRWEAYRQL